MKFDFDKSISDKISFLYESLFDDCDDIITNDNSSSIELLYDPEELVSELFNEWKKLGLFNMLYNQELYIDTIKEAIKLNNIHGNNGNNVHISMLALSFNNLETFDRFLSLFDDYTITIDITYLELCFDFLNKTTPKHNFSFINAKSKLKVYSLNVFGGIFDDLEGLNNDKLTRLSFNNSYVKSINGLGANLRSLNFSYNISIISVTDWSNIKNMNLERLTVDYTKWLFIGIEHLLHFGNMPEEILNINEVSFINHNAFGKLRYYKNYIKNMFKLENPLLKQKMLNLIINKLQYQKYCVK